MNVSVLVWAVTCAVILGLFVFDFHAPRPGAARADVPRVGDLVVGLTSASRWSRSRGVVAVGGEFAGEYFAGYVTEKALSVTTCSVFTVIMATFAVPREFQQKLLLIGIVMALVMRAGFIAAGARPSARSAAFYISGLVLTAAKLAPRGRPREGGRGGNATVDTALVWRFVTTTDDYDGDKFLTTVDGKRAV